MAPPPSKGFPMTLKMRSIPAAFAVLLVLAPLTGAAAAVPEMRFSVRPDPEGSLSEGGDYFVMKAAPGAVVRDALELSNPTQRPVTVRLAAVDAATAQMGGVDYSPSDARPQSAGTWIDLGKASVRVPAGAVELVPFEVSVPEDAPSGVNLAGVAVWTPMSNDENQDEGLDAAMEVHTRRVVAVQVELPGPREPVLVIDGVSAVARPDGMYLQVDIRNEGHGFAEGEGTIELEEGAFSYPFPLDKVVPGTSVGYPIRWRDDAPPDGSYPASVEIVYGSDVAEWEGTVAVGGAVREQLADRGIGEVGKFPMLPALAGALALAGAGAAALLLRRRRRRPAAAVHRAPAATPGGRRSQAPPPPAPGPAAPPRRPPPPPPPPPAARATAG